MFFQISWTLCRSTRTLRMFQRPFLCVRAFVHLPLFGLHCHWVTTIFIPHRWPCGGTGYGDSVTTRKKLCQDVQPRHAQWYKVSLSKRVIASVCYPIEQCIQPQQTVIQIFHCLLTCQSYGMLWQNSCTAQYVIVLWSMVNCNSCVTISKATLLSTHTFSS